MDVTDKNIVIVGFKRTGAAVAKFLAKRGAQVTLTDMADEKDLRAQIESVDHWISKGVMHLELGGHKKETFENADLVVVSPGVPHTILPIQQAVAKKVPVMGEIELAYGFIEEPIIAISGTNGKTTTTELLGHMLKCSGIKNFVGGNIGNPLIEYLDSKEKAQVVVLEVSSFQLDTTEDFKPSVAILLNITHDHLDRYHDIHAYAASKARLFKNQGPEDIAILNGDDLVAYPFLKEITSRKCIFNSNTDTVIDASNNGAVIGKNDITLHFSNEKYKLDLKYNRLVGQHNRENIAAAALGALSIGGTIEGIQKSISDFKGLPHRLAYIDTVGDVAYYNDSKATNVDAVKRAIETFSTPIILIMGGRDKGGEFHLLKHSIASRVKELIVMGEAADLIGDLFRDSVSVGHAKDMEDAVRIAGKCAGKGDTVLLSPGCASFDMYENYAQRGNAFEAAVSKIKQDLK